jgi:hypothetical protein
MKKIKSNPLEKHYNNIPLDDLGTELISTVMETEDEEAILQNVNAFITAYKNRKYDPKTDSQGYLTSAFRYIPPECERIFKLYRKIKKQYKKETGEVITKKRWKQECKRAVNVICDHISRIYDTTFEKFESRIRTLEDRCNKLSTPKKGERPALISFVSYELFHLGQDLHEAGIDDHEEITKIGNIVEQKLDKILRELKDRGDISASDLERAIISTPNFAKNNPSTMYEFGKIEEEE